MSSTTLPRNQRREDFYRTPSWATRAILPVLRRALGGAQPRLIVDAGCGDGAIALEVERAFPGVDVLGIESNAGRVAEARARGLLVHETDYTRVRYASVDVVVSNPPYSDGQALEWVRRSQELVAEQRGVCCFLLPLGWLSSMSRAAWHRANRCDLHVLPKRPSFTGDGKADSVDYGWMLWGPGLGGNWAPLQIEEDAS